MEFRRLGGRLRKNDIFGMDFRLIRRIPYPILAKKV